MLDATLHLETVTPCFLSGADQKIAEWRAASIRGQLRWWFRAVAGAEYGGELAPTKRAEAAVFGSTERSSPLQVVALDPPAYWPAERRWPLDTEDRKLKAAKLAGMWGATGHQPTIDRLTLNRGGREVASDPLQYLAYGCIEYRKQDVGQNGLFLNRPCFFPGQPTSVRLAWVGKGRTIPGAEHQELLSRALWAWLYLGGLGSKARNGFGSLRLTRLEGTLPGGAPTLPAVARDQLEKGIGALLKIGREHGVAPAQARWSQIGKETTVHLGTTPQKTWDTALLLAGAWLMAYRRRYGFPQDSRERDGAAVKDRDYVWAPLNPPQPRGGIPHRSGFGLPLPFGKHGETATWWSAQEQKDGETPVDHRRAAPLHVHVAQVEEGFLPVLAHLPSRLLPEGAKLAYTGHKHPAEDPTQAQLGIVAHFLDDLSGKGLIRPVVPPERKP